MGFLLRPALPEDLSPVLRLANSLSTHGFLTLPTEEGELESLLEKSEESFAGRLSDPDAGRYLFALEKEKKVIGISLIVARHGTPKSPHLFFQVDPAKRTLKLHFETTGRTELGGLILDPAWRGRPEKWGKRLSLVRLLYIHRHPERFRKELLAELLPPFTADGRSPLWEALGRTLTGLDYREADQRSRHDKDFVKRTFPQTEIAIDSLPAEARGVIGQVGTKPVAKILSEVGFRYLHQIDPFDGGPHFGAFQSEIRFDLVTRFLSEKGGVEV